MKVWFEVDRGSGNVFLHLAEPNPVAEGDYWEDKTKQDFYCSGADDLFRKHGIEEGCVAEFELKRIWERA